MQFNTLVNKQNILPRKQKGAYLCGVEPDAVSCRAGVQRRYGGSTVFKGWRGITKKDKISRNILISENVTYVVHHQNA